MFKGNCRTCTRTNQTDWLAQKNSVPRTNCTSVLYNMGNSGLYPHLVMKYCFIYYNQKILSQYPTLCLVIVVLQSTRVERDTNVVFCISTLQFNYNNITFQCKLFGRCRGVTTCTHAAAVEFFFRYGSNLEQH